MAKKTAKTDQPTSQATKSGARSDAIRALCCVTGCGSITAEQQLAAMPAETIQAIADAEASGNRNLVPRILQDLQSNEVAPDPDLSTGSQSADEGTGSAT